MSLPVHFEIHADDVPRAVAFYTTVFGWTTEDWSEFAGTPYIGVSDGASGDASSDTPGISGAIMQRPGPNPERGGAVAGAVLTMGTDDYDALARTILEAGGAEAMPKTALPGMAWQGYFFDTENNVFGVHQPDPEAE